jgi:hypothetical protein
LNPFQASPALFFCCWPNPIELRTEGQMIASPSAGCRLQETTLTELTPGRIKQVPGSLMMGGGGEWTMCSGDDKNGDHKDPKGCSVCAEGRNSRGVRRGGEGDDRFPPSRAPALCSACRMTLTFVKVGRFSSSFPLAASLFITCASAIDSDGVRARWPSVH